ncbi:TolC family protein [Vibrio sp. SCSIO 43136]|uniref:TolC family protein n=1 Tax=Vibrio sp. SCSIO 43136 TaxID=2819101 RepID=UPI0020750168|nr:TolC family protein [Vibrio sp. SCSIO 43136]USD66477.1 TolC family protein [Vibrio sp. SCSIO 43136]
MKKSSLALMLGSVFCLAPISALAQPVSFEQAWQLVQQNNDSLAASQANLQRYQYMQDSRDSLNLPSISLSANYTMLDQNVSVNGQQLLDATSIDNAALASIIGGLVGNIDASGLSTTISDRHVYGSSIRAVWPIFTGGKITAAQDIAAGQTEEARSQFEMERQAKYEDLSKYYFGVVLAQEVLETRKAVEKGLSQHRDFAIKLEKQGQIAKVERLQAEASLDKAKVDRQKAQRDLDIAITALASLLNQSDISLDSRLFVNEVLPPLDAFIDQTIATYPGLRILDAKEKQASNLVKVEKSAYYPNVYLYGDYSLYEHDSLASQMKPDWLVGIGVSVPIIDTNGRSDRAQAAHSAVLQVQYLRDQAKRDLSVLVEKTYLEAEQAVEEVHGLNSSLKLANENLNLRSKAFTQGLSNSLEVVDAELYLASIKTQQHLAKYNYLISLSKLLALSNEMSTFAQYQQSATDSQ